MCLFKEVLALKRFSGMCHTLCSLYGSLSRVLEALSMFLPQKNILFDRYSPRGPSVQLQTAGGGKTFSTSLMGTLEQQLLGVLALVDFQLLMFPKGLLTTFETACILFFVFTCLRLMFLQVLFCVEFLITAASCTKGFSWV